MYKFHEGEKQIQDAAGVALQADQLRGMMQPTMAPAMVQFLAAQKLAVLTTLDQSGAVWVSAIVGEAGFMHALNSKQILVDGNTLPKSDILWHNLQNDSSDTGQKHSAGMVVINFGQRRRVRANGVIRADGDFLVMDISQSYGNCPKYIQRRALITMPDEAALKQLRVSESNQLTTEDKALISASDTFFIGTFTSSSGADASHRGGQPGFVTVSPDGNIIFPDYPGNNMFNTLGNLALEPKLGLLFADYEKGDVLQVTGHANSIDPFKWRNGEQMGHVDVVVDRVIRSQGGALGQWQFGEYSPYNP